ncbi:hypothetical protein [Alloactinosynnema sp. L-07]|nr:hypothetical protein [Alloactinosynnema sp. L-07]
MAGRHAKRPSLCSGAHTGAPSDQGKAAMGTFTVDSARRASRPVWRRAERCPGLGG